MSKADRGWPPPKIPGAWASFNLQTRLLEPDPKAYMAQIIGSKGPLSRPTTAVQPWRRELVFMPHTRHSQYPSGPAQLGGYLPSAPGVSTVRYPIPQRTFKYVATVQSVTDETCQFRTSCPRFSSSARGTANSARPPGLALSEIKNPGAE